MHYRYNCKNTDLLPKFSCFYLVSNLPSTFAWGLECSIDYNVCVLLYLSYLRCSVICFASSSFSRALDRDLDWSRLVRVLLGSHASFETLSGVQTL